MQNLACDNHRNIKSAKLLISIVGNTNTQGSKTP